MDYQRHYLENDFTVSTVICSYILLVLLWNFSLEFAHIGLVSFVRNALPISAILLGPEVVLISGLHCT